VGGGGGLSGCAAKRQESGFLSDYSHLEPAGETSLRYVPSNAALARYDHFLIEPVVLFLHPDAQQKAAEDKDLPNLTLYFRGALVDALADRYQIVSEPGPGVARLRVAITDLKQGKPALNVLPQTKLTGLGLGGATMEAELLDSQSGEQIGAIVESHLGSRISLSGLSKWGDAKAVMDEWAKRFRKRLDEAHDAG
jgi:hypothetical protein